MIAVTHLSLELQKLFSHHLYCIHAAGDLGLQLKYLLLSDGLSSSAIRTNQAQERVHRMCIYRACCSCRRALTHSRMRMIQKKMTMKTA